MTVYIAESMQFSQKVCEETLGMWIVTLNLISHEFCL